MKNCIPTPRLITLSLFCMALLGCQYVAVIAQSSTRSSNSILAIHVSPAQSHQAKRILDAKNPDDLDRLAHDELATLDRITGFPTKLTINDTDELSSYPDRGIIIGRKKLQSIERISGVRQRQGVLRFLLAHEKAHQIQFRAYPECVSLFNKRGELTSEELQTLRLYECQADILAGKHLLETFVKPTSADGQTIEDVLQVSFDQGISESNTTGSHGTHEQRRTAVRFGMASGMITNFETLPPSPPAIGSIATLMQKLDIRAGEFVLPWSLRESKRITHYNREAVQDILLDKEDVNWDTSADHPFVTFKLTYTNTGAKSIDIDMEVQCVAVPRDDVNRDNSKYWQKWSVQNTIFRLKPGEKHTVTGSLMWYGDAKLMPRLIFPPKSTALISCEYVH